MAGLPPPPPSAPPKESSPGWVLACIGLLIPICLLGLLVPAVQESLELANRASCSGNLSQFGKAGQTYAAAHKQQWPKVVADADSRWDEIGNTRADRVEGVAPRDGSQPAKDAGPGTRPHSNTANLWTLISCGYVTPATVICPSTENWRDDTVTDFTNVRDVRGPDYISYSLQNCWGEYLLTSTSSTNASALVIAADVNPQRADFMAASGATARYLARKPHFVHEAWRRMTVSGAWELNSPNHKFQGQNVLYLDGHVDWTDNPWCGVNYDNIWVMRKTNGDPNLNGVNLGALRSWDDGTSYDGKKTLPADSVDDSFLVP
jgi:prepilin-type processing-associated H-X9-DG protein